MEFGSGFGEEDQMSSRCKLPFSYSSSSSPSSSSSQHKSQLVSLAQQQPQMGSWLGNKYDPEEDTSRFNEAGAAANKLELMDVNDQEETRRGDGAVVAIEKEHMFDKVVTPSDVGKLNRLVIPKQHAEKYFPLDSSTNEKGILLNFEDKSGKAWRFRYSYWNSSQSYVMTKGWSRFVKDKKLEAGDIVSFQRGVGELGKDRLYIDWRRRPDALAPTASYHQQQQQHHHSSIPWSPLLMRPPAPMLPRDHLHLTNPNRNAYYRSGAGGGSYTYNYSNYNSNVVNVNPCSSSGSVIYMRPAMAAAAVAAAAPPQEVGMGILQWQQGGVGVGGVVEPLVYESVPVVHGKAAAKRLRLFGVNMDCPINDSNNCDKLSSSSTTMSIPHASVALQSPQLSSPSQHPLQLRLYNSTPPPATPSTQFPHKGKSSMSFDLDI